MGAEQSSESKRKDDEKYQRMMKYALEQQRKMYEEKCKELLHEQQKKTVATEKPNQKSESRNSTVVSETQANYTALYPNLQPDSTFANTQASTSTVQYHAHSFHAPNQNNSILPPLQDRHTHFQTTAMHPNLQHNVNFTSATSYNPRASNNPFQNKPDPSAAFDCQPSAPTSNETGATSKQKHKANTNTKKNTQYQCPSCKSNNLETNIFQCEKGHSSCNLCKMNAVKCGICKSTITNTRNIDLERLIANLSNSAINNVQRVNCPNKIDGCSLSFKPENLQDHLKECTFREMECPLAFLKYRECLWRGKINQIPVHFLEYHPEQVGANVDTEMCFEHFNNNYVLHHVAIGNFNFLVHIKLDSDLEMFFMTIQLIGSLVSASKWSYELHMYDKSEPHRKFTYTDICLPTTIPFNEVTKESKCAALPLHYALSFFKNRKLTYKFYIKRDESKRRPNQRGYNKARPIQSAT